MSFTRTGRKFAIVAATAERLDVGIKLAGIPHTAGGPCRVVESSMVTHRVRMTDPGQFDDELRTWLREAYDAALSR